jgi:hypothetical protein
VTILPVAADPTGPARQGSWIGGSSPIRTQLQKGRNHDGTVRWKRLLHQLQQLRCVLADQGPARAGKQLEEAPHRIRLLWELWSARLLTAGRGAP